MQASVVVVAELAFDHTDRRGEITGLKVRAAEREPCARVVRVAFDEALKERQRLLGRRSCRRDWPCSLRRRASSGYAWSNGAIVSIVIARAFERAAEAARYGCLGCPFRYRIGSRLRVTCSSLGRGQAGQKARFGRRAATVAA